MHKWQEDVQAFHEKFGALVNKQPTVPGMGERHLRRALIDEEVNKELGPAIIDGDLVKIADGMADAIYVILGTAVAFGIDLEPIWEEVHRTNMLKEAGGKRADGKILKPAGWKPPDVVGLLRNQGWNVDGPKDG